jgi:hypothetical protein
MLKMIYIGKKNSYRHYQRKKGWRGGTPNSSGDVIVPFLIPCCCCCSYRISHHSVLGGGEAATVFCVLCSDFDGCSGKFSTREQLVGVGNQAARSYYSITHFLSSETKKMVQDRSLRSLPRNNSVRLWKQLTALLALLLVVSLLRDNFSVFSSLPLPSVSMKDVAKISTATAPETHQQAVNTNVVVYKEYIPASTKQYILDHADELGYASEDNPDGCTIWSDPSVTNKDIHQTLTSYVSDLENYNRAVANFQPTFPDVMDEIINGNYNDVCPSLKLHPDGVSGLLPSNQLSFSSSGYVEPLTPPMRSIGFCKGS